jgi:hypothetical protein
MPNYKNYPSMAKVRVRAHPRRGTRGVRESIRWVVPREYENEVVLIPTEELFAGRYGRGGEIAEENAAWNRAHGNPPRSGDELQIQRIQERLHKGLEIDPVQIIMMPSGQGRLYEGYHRTAAARRVGLRFVPTVSKDKSRIRGRQHELMAYTPGVL